MNRARALFSIGLILSCAALVRAADMDASEEKKPDGGGAAVKEQKAAVDVVLVKLADPAKKIAVIKLVREITGLGLKDAKDIVDKAPHLVKAGVPRADADAMKAKLEKEGATVEFK